MRVFRVMEICMGEGESKIKEFGVEDADSVERAVQRFYAENGYTTYNLSPWGKEEDALILKDIGEELLVAGVPDTLCLGEDDFLLEVKSAGDGLRESQLKWIEDNDFPVRVAYVREIGGETENVIEGDEVIDVKDVRKKFEKGVEKIITLCYGQPWDRTREEIETAILLLRQDHSVSRTELADTLGYDLSDENERRKFDDRISPMRGNNPLGIQVLTDFRESGETYYSLSRQAFDASKDPVLKSIRDALGKKENERIQELSDRIEKLKRQP